MTTTASPITSTTTIEKETQPRKAEAPDQDLAVFSPRLAVFRRDDKVTIVMASSRVDLSGAEAAQLGEAIMNHDQLGLTLAQIGLLGVLAKHEAEAKSTGAQA